MSLKRVRAAGIITSKPAGLCRPDRKRLIDWLWTGFFRIVTEGKGGTNGIGRLKQARQSHVYSGNGLMERNRSRVGFIGITVGAVALLMAIVHFWMGPISTQPSLEQSVAEKAVAIKNATIVALAGETVEEKATPRSIDLDQGMRMATGILGGFALILGVVSFAKGEPFRVGGGAAFLGGASIAFQFAVIAIGAIALAILIGAVLSEIGIE